MNDIDGQDERGQHERDWSGRGTLIRHASGDEITVHAAGALAIPAPWRRAALHGLRYGRAGPPLFIVVNIPHPSLGHAC